MGTWTRNFLLRKANPAQIRDQFVLWLERKGFDRVAGPSPFPEPSDDERIAFLVSNPDWTILFYNQSFEEGDRILQVFEDEAIILEVMIADSDVWGYDLIESGKLTASFNSNPNYFGGDDRKLEENGDPQRLCRVLGLTGKEDAIQRIQKKRSFFADFPCESFCRCIGAPVGAIHCGDLDQWTCGSAEARQIAGWQIEPLYFERRKRFGHEPKEPQLHQLAVREFEIRERSPTMAEQEMAEDIQHIRPQMRGLLLMAHILSHVFRLFALVFSGPLRWWMRRYLKNREAHLSTDPLLKALLSMESKHEPTETGWLVDRRLGFKIKASIQPTPADSILGSLRNPLGFDVKGNEVWVTVVRPEKLAGMLTLRGGVLLRADERFKVGQMDARYLWFEHTSGNRIRFQYSWYIEVEQCVVHFGASSTQALAAETTAEIRAILDTFTRC